MNNNMTNWAEQHTIDGCTPLEVSFKASPRYEGNGRVILRDIRPYYSYYDEEKVSDFANFVKLETCDTCWLEAKFVAHTVGWLCELINETETTVVDKNIKETVEEFATWYGFKFHNVGIGQKVTRLIMKICRLAHIDEHEEWYKYYAAFCDVVNALAIRKTIIFSINEDDMKVAENWYGWLCREHYNAVMFMLDDSFNGNIDCMPYATLFLHEENPGTTLHDSFIKEMLSLAFEK